MAVKLTEAVIRRLAAAPLGKRVEKPDALAPGLVLRVNDKGAKQWLARYRLHGKQAKLALGAWPALGLAEARDKARQVRELAEAGVDPRPAAEAERAEIAEAAKTFADLAEQYIARECPRLAEGRTLESLLRREIIPALGSVAVGDLRKRHAVRLLDKLVDSGRLGVARRAHWVIKRITKWSQLRDEIEVDPFAGLPCPMGKARRERVLSHDELRTLWQAWLAQGYPFGPLQRLLLLTATRRTEAAEMRWDELDDPDRPTVWELPASRTKNGRAHLVPLSQPARALIAELPRFVGPFVFTTQGGERPVSGFTKARERADKLSEKIAGEAVEDWGWHDLRRTARTELARLGISDEVAERVLNHAPGGLLETYNRHRYRAEIAEALERWAAELLRIVGESEAEPRVIAIGEARR